MSSVVDKITGKFKQAAGNVLDDPELRREGRREQRKGEAKDELKRQDEKLRRKAQEIADLERKTA